MSLQCSGPCPRLAAHRLLSRSARTFSTTPAVLFNDVPPESPTYIRLPVVPQTSDPSSIRVRGRLPIPRNVFPGKDGYRKIRREYVEKTAPKRTNDAEPVNDVQEWKLKMANTRRDSLKSGLSNLWNRHKHGKESRTRQLRLQLAEQREAANAPERADDQMTRGTVLKAVEDTKVYPDPDRFLRAQRSRAKVLAMENARREARRDALVELYMGASKFIVHESELQAEIEATFADDFFHKQSQTANRLGITENAWGVYGKPMSIAQMLAYTTGSSTRTIHYDETEYDRSAQRQKSVAEELTGGKMK
ncbi:hypothetical protein S40285_04313 [Stachybotrys chlorohalonatus IBT 40285]|uniref:Uncharacterized protein n=1 Tax=Stachybotrys chlorohalonatus (strain IBT 40285) TaxID=1283841 RepID=A0A084QNM8_STAC4|nr:hypothetical protein S40285_04313 [Stachybotrys chlorohalonata IBT 40285]